MSGTNTSLKNQRKSYISRKKRNMTRLALNKETVNDLLQNDLNRIDKIFQFSKKTAQEVLKSRAELITKPQTPQLSTEIIELLLDNYNSNKQNKIRENTISNTGIDYAVTDRSILHKLNYAYSHELDRVPRATTQDYSGRCWLFAALNSIRTHLIGVYNLPDHFELSESYLFFWDKIERSYCFLNTMAGHRKTDISEPLYQHLLRSNSPLQDGGNWGHVVNLILKYGLVPKTVYNESFNSSFSDEMNSLLHSRLIVFNQWLRDNAALSDDEITDAIVTRMMPDIFQLVANCLGCPPMPNQEFTWQYNECGDNFESLRQKGAYHSIPNLTPLSFYNDLVAPYYDIERKVFISDDPRHETGKTYTVDYTGCMVGGLPEITFNVDMDEFRKSVARSIINKQPVWFACDVGKDFDPYNSLLNSKVFKEEEYFNQKFRLDKAAAISSLSSYPTHAMCFVGLNTIDNSVDAVDKWKVENSWGVMPGETNDPGYLQMDDDWFRRYVYTAVVDIECLNPELQKIYEQVKYKPVRLPYNDAFGSVAGF